MADKTLLTAPKAVIKVTGINGEKVPIGKMKNLRVSEQISRGEVIGLGNMTQSEVPPLTWRGTVNVSQYAIKLSSGILNSIARDIGNTKEFVKNLLFNDGIDIDIMMKTKNADGEVVETTFATIEGAHITGENFDINEGQIGGRDASFQYINPIIYNV